MGEHEIKAETHQERMGDSDVLLIDLDTSLNCIYVIQVITFKTWYRVKKREPVAAGSLASFSWKEVINMSKYDFLYVLTVLTMLVYVLSK